MFNRTERTHLILQQSIHGTRHRIKPQQDTSPHGSVPDWHIRKSLWDGAYREKWTETIKPQHASERTRTGCTMYRMINVADGQTVSLCFSALKLGYKITIGSNYAVLCCDI